MTSPADELLDLARADIGLSVALAQAKDGEDVREIVRRQKDVQRRMRELQRRVISAEAQSRAAPSASAGKPRTQFASAKGGARCVGAPERLPGWLRS